MLYFVKTTTFTISTPKNPPQHCRAAAAAAAVAVLMASEFAAAINSPSSTNAISDINSAKTSNFNTHCVVQPFHYYHTTHQCLNFSNNNLNLINNNEKKIKKKSNLCAKTIDSLNYWKRAFGNPEQTTTLSERIIRIGVLTTAIQNNKQTLSYFPNIKDQKLAMSGCKKKNLCKNIQFSSRLPLCKTFLPVQKSPQLLKNSIAQIKQKFDVSEVDSKRNSEIYKKTLKFPTENKTFEFFFKKTQVSTTDKRRKLSPIPKQLPQKESNTKNATRCQFFSQRMQDWAQINNSDKHLNCYGLDFNYGNEKINYFMPSMEKLSNIISNRVINDQQNYSNNGCKFQATNTTLQHTKNTNNINFYNNDNLLFNYKEILKNENFTGKELTNASSKNTLTNTGHCKYDDEDGTLVFAIEI